MLTRDRFGGTDKIESPFPFPTDSEGQDKFEPICRSLRESHPHFCCQEADGNISKCLTTVWTATIADFKRQPEMHYDKLLGACLKGLIPIQWIVDSLSHNPRVQTSLGVFEGYQAISGRIDRLFEQTQDCWPDRKASWICLRNELSSLMQLMAINPPQPTEPDVIAAREELLGEEEESGCIVAA